MENVTETKKRGRKPQGEAAMPGRTRTLVYRQRRKREMVEAIGAESDAKSTALLDLLGWYILRLEKGGDPETVTATKMAVARIQREFCRRYEIETPIPGQE